MSDELSLAQARRIALAAQGFLDPAHTPPTLRTLSRTVGRTGVLQVDSVNVLQRAHFMPLYSRMGPYDVDLLARASAGRAQRKLVEYWAHVQAFMPTDLWPVMQHRMAQYRALQGKWWQMATPELNAELIAQITERGACTARDLDRGEERTKDHWGWNWSQARKALDYLFMVGEVAMAGRNSAFEARYDLPERVIPAAHLNAPVPTEEDAHRELVRRAAAAHGVATVACLADYYRMSIRDTTRAVGTLVEDGELLPVRIEGWRRPAYLHHAARKPRRVQSATVLSPFDPLVWHRERAEQLFGFTYRIEIYTPAPKRTYGYYVLPFLLDDQLVGRVDLKADRAAGVLRVPGAFAEAGAPPHTAAALAVELRRLAGWLGLDDVAVGERGDLAAPLTAELGHG